MDPASRIPGIKYPDESRVIYEISARYAWPGPRKQWESPSKRLNIPTTHRVIDRRRPSMGVAVLAHVILRLSGWFLGVHMVPDSWVGVWGGHQGTTPWELWQGANGTYMYALKYASLWDLVYSVTWPCSPSCTGFSTRLLLRSQLN